MRIAESRPWWQTAILVVLFSAAVTGLVYVFRGNLAIQVAIFAILGAGLSLTGLREETREATMARLFMGPFLFATSLYTVIETDAALVPAVAFGLPAMYYSFAGAVIEDPLGVHDDRTGNR